jgi:hypothetical protein
MLEKVMLNGGRFIMVEPKKAVEVRARQKQLDDMSRQVSKELSRTFPGLYGSGLAGRGLGSYVGSSYVPRDKEMYTPRSPGELAVIRKEQRRVAIERRWEEIVVV